MEPRQISVVTYILRAVVAQQAEQSPCKRQVAGSKPCRWHHSRSSYDPQNCEHAGRGDRRCSSVEPCRPPRIAAVVRLRTDGSNQKPANGVDHEPADKIECHHAASTHALHRSRRTHQHGAPVFRMHFRQSSSVQPQLMHRRGPASIGASLTTATMPGFGFSFRLLIRAAASARPCRRPSSSPHRRAR